MSPGVRLHHTNCFACGDDNPAGIGLQLHVEGERVKGAVTFDRRQEGAPGFVHGGAVATVLDDALGSLMLLTKKPAVTAKLEINYRRPAFIDRDFEVSAWVERIDGRKLTLVGEMCEDGEVVAEASGLFLNVDVEHFMQGVEEMPEAWREARDRARMDLPW